MAALPLSTAEARRHAHAPAAAPDTSSGGYTAELRLVPRRRRTASLVVVFVVVLASMMLGAAILHTRLAERQLLIDDLEHQVDEAQARFEVLRGQRAELRSPGRLAAAAAERGMRATPTTDFVPVDRWVLARAIASAGLVERSNVSAKDVDPLQQFRAVKARSQGVR